MRSILRYYGPATATSARPTRREGRHPERRDWPSGREWRHHPPYRRRAPLSGRPSRHPVVACSLVASSLVASWLRGLVASWPRSLAASQPSRKHDRLAAREAGADLRAHHLGVVRHVEVAAGAEGAVRDAPLERRESDVLAFGREDVDASAAARPDVAGRVSLHAVAARAADVL